MIHVAKNNLLIVFGLVMSNLPCLLCSAQTHLELNSKLSSHPQDFFFSTAPLGERVSYAPIYGLDFGSRKYGSNATIFWDANLIFRHTRITEEGVASSLTHPSPQSGSSSSYRRVLNYAGLSIGGGYALRLNRIHRLPLAMGVKSMVGFASRFRNESSSYPIFKATDLASRLYYGFYLQPGYELSLSRRGTSPWHVRIFLNSEVLFRNHTNFDTIFLWGGGLGVSYRMSR